MGGRYAERNARSCPRLTREIHPCPQEDPVFRDPPGERRVKAAKGAFAKGFNLATLKVASLLKPT
eukprot:7200049-Alexandrium_andersonii.AAC.1